MRFLHQQTNKHRVRLCSCIMFTMALNKTDMICNLILGAIILSCAWGVSTVLHEVCHFIVAGLLGYETSIGAFTFTTGSVFVIGEMSAVDTALVAVAGSAGLVVAGGILVRCTDSTCLKMCGIVFLCRAWVDALPIGDMDGGLIAGSVGIVIAYAVVIIEVLLSGWIIYEEIDSDESV